MPVGGIAEIGDLQRALSRMALRVQRAELARQSYIGAMTQGQEEERLRLARELHDDTVQSLIALGQRVQMVERQFKVAPEKAEQKLVELRQLVSETLDNVRRLIRDMRPTYLEDLGLIPALKALCTDVADSQPFSVTFSVEGPQMRFVQEVDLALYRITQEALSNVARHAAASHVEVRLQIGDTSTLTISDDGQGFMVPVQPSEFASAGHFGLMSMAERVRLVGGRLGIDSEPGKGTRISVQFQRN
jgi:signal transduction histidine kinase